jgi:N-glycosylase/DNA lyase
MFSIEEGKITAAKKDLNIRATLDCGQVFRFTVAEDGRRELISGSRRCVLWEDRKKTLIRAAKHDIPYFINYFDLKQSYAPMIKELEDSPLMKAAAAFGRGLRILRQDRFETLISFIVSTNNNIARIRGIIERICAALGCPLGKPKTGTVFYGFPGPEAMAGAGEKMYRELGCGYRSPWIARAAEKAASSSLDVLAGLPTEKLTGALQSFAGVGPKAADCIALFAYARYDVFPVDTWVKKLYRDLFNAVPAAGLMRKNLIARFGRFSGIAQQQLFYYYRERAGAAV